MAEEKQTVDYEKLYKEKCKEYDNLSAAAQKLANDYENVVIEKDALILQLRYLKQQLQQGGK